MAPFALEQLEARKAGEAKARPTRRSRKDEEEEQPLQRTDWIDNLAQTLSEGTGVAIDLDHKDLPPEGRTSRARALADALDLLTPSFG